MQYTSIRDMNISKLTLGTVQLGMEYGIANKKGKPSQEESFNILQAATEGGVNSFDTSLLYGDSEVVLGNYFSSSKYSIRNLVLTTKFKIRHDKNLTRDDIERQMYEFVEQSMRRLKIEKIPVYMLHNPDDMVIYGDIVPKTLKRLKNEGLIGIAAVSVYTSEEAYEMMQNEVYEAIQIPMNIFDNRLIKSGAISKLHENNKIIFVRSIFLQGLFFMNPESLTGNLVDAKDLLLNLDRLASKEGMSIQQLALSYIRDMEGVTSLVIGAETPEQVEENIKLMEGPSISEKTKYEISMLFDNIPTHILNPGLWRR
jgi:aryl-alcohol dehydrogenase-like predicted oxidoreductase